MLSMGTTRFAYSVFCYNFTVRSAYCPENTASSFAVKVTVCKDALTAGGIVLNCPFFAHTISTNRLSEFPGQRVADSTVRINSLSVFASKWPGILEIRVERFGEVSRPWIKNLINHCLSRSECDISGGWLDDEGNESILHNFIVPSVNLVVSVQEEGKNSSISVYIDHVA